MKSAGRIRFGFERESAKSSGPLVTGMGTTLTVEGLSCSGCEQSVETAISKVPGVRNATAEAVAGTVTVDGDADAETLRAAVSAAGFEARP